MGDTVIYRYAGSERRINGSLEHPAMITRVLTDSCVNLRVLTDGAGIPWKVAVLHRDHAALGDDCWHWRDEPAPLRHD